MESNKKCCNNGSCLGLLYDILGQVISVLDVTTDIIVCIQYYQKDRLIFFGISLTILCLALIAYDTVFMMNHSKETHWKMVALFFTMLPLSPFIPYLMYFTANPQSKLSIWLKKFCCFKLVFDYNNWDNEDKSKLKQFMRQKISEHLGFIVEALVEGMICIILSNIMYSCLCTYIYSSLHIFTVHTQHFLKQFFKWQRL